MCQYIVKICNSDNVEDEIHMLCICEMYNTLRHDMYDRVSQICNEFNNWNNQEKLVSVQWKEVANFLDQAWNIRTQKLYTTA